VLAQELYKWKYLESRFKREKVLVSRDAIFSQFSWFSAHIRIAFILVEMLSIATKKYATRSKHNIRLI